MSFPTTERFKILANSVSEQGYNWDRGLPIKDTTFHGVIMGIERDSELDYCYLLVAPFPPAVSSPGDLTFLGLGEDPADETPSDSRYVKVYVLNLPLAAVEAFYQEGDIITFWRYSGQAEQVSQIRGSYVTFWCNQGQFVVEILSPTSGSGVYNGRRLNLVGTVGPRSAPNDLSLPLPETDIASSADCLVLNLLEAGTTGSHWVPNNTWTIGLQVAVTDVDIAVAETPAIAVSIQSPGAAIPGGTFCDTSYVDIVPAMDRIAFQEDEFVVAQDGANLRVGWAGMTLFRPADEANPAFDVCDAKQIEFIDDSTVELGTVVLPTISHTVSPLDDGNDDRFSVFFDLDLDDLGERTACNNCTVPATKQTAIVSAEVFIPDCQYRPTINDCATVPYACTSTINFGHGFTLTGSDGTVNISLGLQINSSSSAYMTLTSDGSDCKDTLTFCTTTVTPTEITTSSHEPVTITPAGPLTVVTAITGATCNEDGTITIDTSTSDIYYLSSGSAFYTLDSGSTFYTLGSSSAFYAFPSSSAITVIGSC